jgi:hypothetical protein
VYALENLVDLLSTCVVLWRFFAPMTLDDALERKLKQREDRASVAISFIMVVLGFAILATALADFARGPEWAVQQKAVLVMSFFSVIFFGVLSVLKFRFAARLESPSMRKDGICSLIGAILGVTLFVNTLIVVVNSDLWWIDPIVAFAAGIGAIYLGVRALWEAYTSEGLAICSASFWSGSDGESSTKSTADGDDIPVNLASVPTEDGGIV